MTDRAPGWSAVTASARGSQHDRTGLPNQDAVAAVQVAAPVPAVVAAVADGHGGARYVRSDIGSRTAVDVACRCAAAFLAGATVSLSPRSLMRAAESSLVPEIVGQWRAEVLEDAARRAFTPVERDRAAVDLDADPVIAYGATLLLAIASERWLLLVQIGDGDIVVSSGEGRVSTPVPGDDRLAGGQTTSLCLPTAARDARIAVVPAEERTALVLLSSDGYGNSFADGGWRDSVARDMREQIARFGLDGVGQRLPGWLADSARVGGDDVSLALLARAVPPAPVSRARSRRPATIALVAAGALVLGGLGGWFLRGAPRATSATAVTTLPELPPSSTAAIPTTTTTVVATSTTTTIAPATTTNTSVVPPGSEAPAAHFSFMSGAQGQLVLFSVDGTGPPIQVSETSDVTGATTLQAADLEWRVQSSALQFRRLDQRQWKTVQLKIDAGTLTVAGDRVWVLSPDAKALVSIDPDAQPPQAGEVLDVLVPGGPAEGGNDGR